MKNYTIYKNEYCENDIIVRVCNHQEMQSVQKEIVGMGYIIVELIDEQYFKAYKEA